MVFGPIFEPYHQYGDILFTDKCYLDWFHSVYLPTIYSHV